MALRAPGYKKSPAPQFWRENSKSFCNGLVMYNYVLCQSAPKIFWRLCILEHPIVDVSGWRSMFSFPKSHRQMYWVAVHMTSQLPEGTVMQLDAKTCDICDLASTVMLSSEDAHERNASAARAALASLWSLSQHMTQFGCSHFLTRASTYTALNPFWLSHSFGRINWQTFPW